MERTVHSTIFASVKTEESVLITQLVNALMNMLELNVTFTITVSIPTVIKLPRDVSIMRHLSLVNGNQVSVRGEAVLVTYDICVYLYIFV